MSEAFLVCLSLCYLCNIYDLDVFSLFVCVSCVSFFECTRPYLSIAQLHSF